MPYKNKEDLVLRRQIRYEARIAAGLCVYCGNTQAKGGRKCCYTCQDVNRDRDKTARPHRYSTGEIKVETKTKIVIKTVTKTRTVRLDDNAVSRDTQSRLRSKVLEHFGGECFKCGISDKRVLQLDHVHGGGSKHIKGVSWSVRYQHALDNPNLYQLLCANCNWIKRHENREFRNGSRS